MTKRAERHLSDEAADEKSAEYATLVRAAAGGDHESMERLLMRAQESAFRFSLLVCGHVDDAEDVMQEALLKTYRYACDSSRSLRERRACSRLRDRPS